MGDVHEVTIPGRTLFFFSFHGMLHFQLSLRSQKSFQMKFPANIQISVPAARNGPSGIEVRFNGRLEIKPQTTPYTVPENEAKKSENIAPGKPVRTPAASIYFTSPQPMTSFLAMSFPAMAKRARKSAGNAPDAALNPRAVSQVVSALPQTSGKQQERINPARMTG